MNHTAKFDKRIAIAIILGNTLAWADFALYAYFSPILSHIFFPFTSESTAYILYFIIFALGFLFRPIGSTIAGVFADKHGRKNTLLATVIISAVVTTLIGCLPSYNTIGFFSPLLLTILRIVQTMAVSAEPTNSGSLLIEHADPTKKGLVTSCVMIGIFLGFLVGVFSFLLIVDYLTLEQIEVWGWRLPFVSSLAIGAVVAKFLFSTKESPLFISKKAEGKLNKTPLLDSFRFHKKAMLITFGYSIMMAATNYFLLGFIPNFLNSTVGLTLKDSNQYITISVLVTVILLPILGYISDIVGRKPVLTAGAIGYLLLSYPIIWMIASRNPILIVFSLVIYGALLAPVAAVLPAAIAEIFPFSVRCTAGAIGYNVALVLVGGTTPIVAELVLHYTNNILSPAWLLMSVAAVHLIFVLTSQETKDRDVNV